MVRNRWNNFIIGKNGGFQWICGRKNEINGKVA